uniref:Dynein heavy chain C-terminal domain-containing protein n=1 Tax=Oryzias latipes TaxID=8090 RepID=A0A3P9L641_ORYLA
PHVPVLSGRLHRALQPQHPEEHLHKCSPFLKMLIVRSLRPDRVSFCITSFVIQNLGNRFVEPPALDMKEASVQNSFSTPQERCTSTPCLSVRLIKQLQLLKPHPNFRLWLSSSPHPEFPITILQAGIKMTTEPPKVPPLQLRSHQMPSARPGRCSKPGPYRKLLFSLCFFHSLLQERKKFQQLGWNVVYDFNHSDFEVSENLLCFYLDKYDNIPWDALKHLIADIIYGGHVTDQWDRRLLTTYMDDFFCDAAITQPLYKLSSLPDYCIPANGPQSSYSLHIQALPSTEHPELFGQHPNADIASQIAETKMLFDNLLSMQPQFSSSISGGAQPTKEDVLELIKEIRGKIPAQIDYEATRSRLQDSSSPLNVVLLQEIERYNSLLQTIMYGLLPLLLIEDYPSLQELESSVFAYPSLKPLAAWTRDLHQRVAQFGRWANTAQPPILFWLSGFTSPNGFLTAVLQSYARHIIHGVFGYHQDGVFVWGLFLEGASWDTKNSCLVEPTPMQMVCPVPPIHFKPVKKRKKPSKSMYLCPCYYYPVRAGKGSFVVGVELGSGAETPEHWIKRGTALLMSLDN